MVDLSGGPEGPIEHGFSNSVFIVPAIVVIGLTGADGGFEAPSIEKILQALEGMQGLSLEDKEALKTQLLQQKMRESYGDELEQTWGEIPADSLLANQTFVLFSLLCIIALVFVFFGLKLYRSLVEKERKREEKKKLKMQKKKK
ncbi:Protein orai-2 [Frankliniella fusca]|uniref:Protein orai-2 n=1 Tax=Frankliniella fusca TaxID=407009 RepID=A0AAE1HYC7_9NEOP|nr:Protein orai-2 [Frankliniella fusca]